MRNTVKRCHKCGREWIADKRQPAFKDYCEGCSAYLHACRNCRFHDPHAHNQCAIPTTDWVADRTGPNFCEDFEFAEAKPDTDPAAKQDKARHAFGALFGDAAGRPNPAVPRDQFDALFGAEPGNKP